MMQGPVQQVSLQVTHDATTTLNAVDCEPWVRAASDFEMNVDFDVSSATRMRRMDLKDLMSCMKDMSTGKRTIQALADKLTLHKLLENMNVPQMPALLSIDGHVKMHDVKRFVHKYLKSEEEDVVIKPTHLSNGTGVLILSRPKPDEVQPTIELLYSHINHFLAQKAGAHESMAMRSLKPGFVVQPKYKSSVGFKTPLELRVVVLWGKARLALWWWGRGAAPEEFPNRNAWFVRRPTNGVLTDQDQWQVVHEHTGSNPGFDRALELFQAHISAMAACAEAIAVAVGAPFLRSDFFVGSPRWGVRLNEVAYGCGVEYRNRTEEGRVIDDAPAIARILQDGFAQCRKRYASEHFFKRFGVNGHSYADMMISPLPARLRAPLPTRALSLGVQSYDDCEVTEDLCKTVHTMRMGRHAQRASSWGPGRLADAGRSQSWYAGVPKSISFQAPAWPHWPNPRSRSFRVA